MIYTEKIPDVACTPIGNVCFYFLKLNSINVITVIGVPKRSYVRNHKPWYLFKNNVFTLALHLCLRMLQGTACIVELRLVITIELPKFSRITC